MNGPSPYQQRPAPNQRQSRRCHPSSKKPLYRRRVQSKKTDGLDLDRLRNADPSVDRVGRIGRRPIRIEKKRCQRPFSNQAGFALSVFIDAHERIKAENRSAQNGIDIRRKKANLAERIGTGTRSGSHVCRKKAYLSPPRLADARKSKR